MLVRVGARAALPECVLGIYPATTEYTKKKDGAVLKPATCWVVIQGQEPLHLAWTVGEAMERWNNRAPGPSCAFGTDTEEYAVRRREVWGG